MLGMYLNAGNVFEREDIYGEGELGKSLRVWKSCLTNGVA